MYLHANGNKVKIAGRASLGVLVYGIICTQVESAYRKNKLRLHDEEQVSRVVFYSHKQTVVGNYL